MNEIELKYMQLSDNKKSVEEQINELLNIVSQINTKCKSLNDGDIWGGLVASKFQETTTRLHNHASKKVLDFMKTNEYKSVVINEFIDAENISSNSYNR